MEYKIEANYKANVLFEFSVAIDGYSYLVIYGKHINGYFCAIPNWGFGCEMSESGDIYYNSINLVESGLDELAAKAIANAIHEKMKGGK